MSAGVAQYPSFWLNFLLFVLRSLLTLHCPTFSDMYSGGREQFSPHKLLYAVWQVGISLRPLALRHHGNTQGCLPCFGWCGRSNSPLCVRSIRNIWQDMLSKMHTNSSSLFSMGCIFTWGGNPAQTATRSYTGSLQELCKVTSSARLAVPCPQRSILSGIFPWIFGARLKCYGKPEPPRKVTR